MFPNQNNPPPYYNNQPNYPNQSQPYNNQPIYPNQNRPYNNQPSYQNPPYNPNIPNQNQPYYPSNVPFNPNQPLAPPYQRPLTQQPSHYQTFPNQPNQPPIYQSPSYQPQMNQPPIYQAPPYQPQLNPPPPIGFQSSMNPGIRLPFNSAPIGQPPQFDSLGGRKKALLIGINYHGSKNSLKGTHYIIESSGCINDVSNMKRFLIERYGFTDTKETMVVLTDDQTDPYLIPTRANMIYTMNWFVSLSDLKGSFLVQHQGYLFICYKRDSLFFHFSGHGGRVLNTTGDEEDGYDDTILPLDWQQAGEIVDNEMNIIMAKSLPPGVRLIALFDSCHSGTALDLPYTYTPDGQLKQRTNTSRVGSILRDSVSRGLNMETGLEVIHQLSRVPNANKAHDMTLQTKWTYADVVSFSGCKDRQTSADTTIQGFGSTGAMSYAFISVLRANPRPSWMYLLGAVREVNLY